RLAARGGACIDSGRARLRQVHLRVATDPLEADRLNLVRRGRTDVVGKARIGAVEGILEGAAGRSWRAAGGTIRAGRAIDVHLAVGDAVAVDVGVCGTAATDAVAVAGLPGDAVEVQVETTGPRLVPLRWCRPRERATCHKCHGDDGGQHGSVHSRLPSMSGAPWTLVPFSTRALGF